MLLLMIVMGFVFMLLSIKNVDDDKKSVPCLVISLLFFFASVIGASDWVASAGIEEHEAENQRIYEVIESQMSSTKDKSLNQVEQMFLEKQVELYIENQQLIQEKRESREVKNSFLYWGLFPFTNIQQ